MKKDTTGGIKMDKCKKESLLSENMSLIECVVNTVTKKSRNLTRIIDMEDLYQDGCIAFCKACDTYNSEAGASLQTYAVKVIKNAILDSLRKMEDPYKEQHLEDLEHVENMAVYECLEQAEMSAIIDWANEQIEDVKRYNVSQTVKNGLFAIQEMINGKEKKEIADELGTNTRQLSVCISRARTLLKERTDIEKLIEFM